MTCHVIDPLNTCADNAALNRDGDINVELEVNGQTLKLTDKHIETFWKIVSQLFQFETAEQVIRHLPTETFAGLPELYNIVSPVSRKYVDAISQACQALPDKKYQIYPHIQIFGASQHNITLLTGPDKPKHPRKSLNWEIDYLLRKIKTFREDLRHWPSKDYPVEKFPIPLKNTTTSGSSSKPETPERHLFTPQPRLDTCHCTIL